jgi:hypothetical protein
MKSYTTIDARPNVTVKANNPDEAARLVEKKLNEISLAEWGPGSLLGGDPLTDFFDTERGYVFRFSDGSEGCTGFDDEQL